MNCYFHASRISNAQCRMCGRALCVECFNKGCGVCPECALEDIKKGQKQISRDFIVFGIAFIVTLFIAICSGSKQQSFLVAYIIAATMFGYRFVVRIFPKNFVVFRISSAIFYGSVKVFLGFIIGWAVAPWQLFKSLRNYIKLKQQERQTLT